MAFFDSVKSLSKFLFLVLSENSLFSTNLHTTIERISIKASTLCDEIDNMMREERHTNPASNCVRSTKLMKTLSSSLFLMKAIGEIIYRAEVHAMKLSNVRKKLDSCYDNEYDSMYQDKSEFENYFTIASVLPEEIKTCVQGLLRGFSKIVTKSHDFLRYTRTKSSREKMARGLEIPEKILQELQDTWLVPVRKIHLSKNTKNTYMKWCVKLSPMEDNAQNLFQALCGDTERKKEEEFVGDILSLLKFNLSIVPEGSFQRPFSLNGDENETVNAKSKSDRRIGLRGGNETHLEVNSMSLSIGCNSLLQTPSPDIGSKQSNGRRINGEQLGTKRPRDTLRLEESVLLQCHRTPMNQTPKQIFLFTVETPTNCAIPSIFANGSSDAGDLNPPKGKSILVTIRALKVKYKISGDSCSCTLPPNTITLPMDIPLTVDMDDIPNIHDTSTTAKDSDEGRTSVLKMSPRVLSMALPLCIHTIIHETIQKYDSRGNVTSPPVDCESDLKKQKKNSLESILYANEDKCNIKSSSSHTWEFTIMNCNVLATVLIL